MRWPLILLGTPTTSPPHPWTEFQVDGLMVNALQFQRCRLQPREALSFEGRYLFMDSGGFQILRKRLPVSVDSIARVYTLCAADAYLSLDYPPSPLDEPGEAEKKYEASFRNWLMLRRLVGDHVIPVLHVYRDEKLFIKYLDKYLDYNPPMLAIGGAVPYVLVTRGVPKGSRLLAMKLIALARAEFGGWLHVLGLGSPSVTPILAILGVDSTDTSTWRVKAAYGKVILPGGGERHVTGRSVRFGRRRIEQHELAELDEFLRATGFRWNLYTLLHSFEGRALINAWVVTRSRAMPRSPIFRKMMEDVALFAESIGLKAALREYPHHTSYESSQA